MKVTGEEQEGIGKRKSESNMTVARVGGQNTDIYFNRALKRASFWRDP
jgi:hypothetical protein